MISADVKANKKQKRIKRSGGYILYIFIRPTFKVLIT